MNTEPSLVILRPGIIESGPVLFWNQILSNSGEMWISLGLARIRTQIPTFRNKEMILHNLTVCNHQCSSRGRIPMLWLPSSATILHMLVNSAVVQKTLKVQCDYQKNNQPYYEMAWIHATCDHSFSHQMTLQPAFNQFLWSFRLSPPMWPHVLCTLTPFLPSSSFFRKNLQGQHHVLAAQEPALAIRIVRGHHKRTKFKIWWQIWKS